MTDETPINGDDAHAAPKEAKPPERIIPEGQEVPVKRRTRQPAEATPGDVKPRSSKAGVEETHLKGVLSSTKGKKEPELLITVFPREGGAPRLERVRVEDGGTFTREGRNQTYYIAPGTVWKEKDEYRAIVNEGNAMTISGHSLTGDETLNPEALHGVKWCNIWWQWDDEVRNKNPWRMAAGIGMGLAVVAIIGVMIWMIFSIGHDMAGIERAIENIQIKASSSSTPAGQAGHQPIAPGGS